MTADFEREFLMRLAATWMLCRWKVMGHAVCGSPTKPDLAFELMGMCDYAWEMRFVCKEELKRRS